MNTPRLYLAFYKIRVYILNSFLFCSKIENARGDEQTFIQGKFFEGEQGINQVSQ